MSPISLSFIVLSSRNSDNPFMSFSPQSYDILPASPTQGAFFASIGHDSVSMMSSFFVIIILARRKISFLELNRGLELVEKRPSLEGKLNNFCPKVEQLFPKVEQLFCG